MDRRTIVNAAKKLLVDRRTELLEIGHAAALANEEAQARRGDAYVLYTMGAFKVRYGRHVLQILFTAGEEGGDRLQLLKVTQYRPGPVARGVLNIQ